MLKGKVIVFYHSEFDAMKWEQTPINWHV